MSANLKPGTLCFLTKVRPHAHAGRIVEIVGGPRAEFGDGPGLFYEISADWLAERYGVVGKDVFVCLREQLIPITPCDGQIEQSACDAQQEAA